MDESQCQILTKKYIRKHFANVYAEMEIAKEYIESIVPGKAELPVLFIADSSPIFLFDFRHNKPRSRPIGKMDRGVLRPKTFDIWFHNAACFTPLHGGAGSDEKIYYALSVNHELINDEAKECGINSEALLEILIVHELVHYLMFSRKYNSASDKNELFFTSECRFIHESCALHVCNQFGKKNLIDLMLMNAYLDHVQIRSKGESRDGIHYIKYFEEYVGCGSQEFWSVVSDNICFRDTLNQ